MNKAQRFTKIAGPGSPGTENVFGSKVEVTEKLDGSQIFWWLDENGQLHISSKNQILSTDPIEPGMFRPAIETILRGYENLGSHRSGYHGIVFYGEAFQKPKHNKLAYDRVPKNHIALFGMANIDRTGFVADHDELSRHAGVWDIDVVPLLYEGMANLDAMKEIIDQDSYLGGVKMEGVVVKNYSLPYKDYPITCIKVVSQEFREKMERRNRAPKERKGFDPVIVELSQMFTTDARFDKAVQWLAEQNLLTHSMQDIKPLMDRAREDIIEEHSEEINEILQSAGIDPDEKAYGSIFRVGLKRLPQWYQSKLEERVR